MEEMQKAEARRLFAEGDALFSLLGRLIYGVPDRELINEVAVGRLYEDVPFLSESDELGKAAAELAVWGDGWLAVGKDDAFSDLRAEYTRMFVGKQRVVAPLWESVYFNRDRMVFQQETFQVRAMYQRHGLQIDKLSHEPDDHLGYELLFLAALFRECGDFAAQGDWDAVAATWADARSFAVCHPLSWVPQWNELVQQRSRSPFYRGYALLVLAALRGVESARLPVG